MIPQEAEAAGRRCKNDWIAIAMHGLQASKEATG